MIPDKTVFHLGQLAVSRVVNNYKLSCTSILKLQNQKILHLTRLEIIQAKFLLNMQYIDISKNIWYTSRNGTQRGEFNGWQ